jgi:hypothetical protein
MCPDTGSKRDRRNWKLSGEIGRLGDIAFGKYPMLGLLDILVIVQVRYEPLVIRR